MSTNNPFAHHTNNLFASRGCDIDQAMSYAQDMITALPPEMHAHATTALMVVVNTAANAWAQSQGPSPAQEVAAAWVRDLVAQEIDKHASGMQDKVSEYIADWMEAVSADHEFTYADAYSALFLGARYDGSFIDVDEHRHGRMAFSAYVDAENSPPEGVYQNLDAEAWEELVNDQYADMDVDLTIRRWVEDKADDLYRDLRDEHEHLTSEESFIEACEFNDITFEVRDEICT